MMLSPTPVKFSSSAMPIIQVATKIHSPVLISHVLTTLSVD